MKFEVKYQHNNHSVGDSLWHIYWCTKYRYNMFRRFKYKSLCEACIRKVAHKHNIEIVVMSVMPDHVHLIARLPYYMTSKKAVRLLKGASSYFFFRAHPKARLRYPQGHLWSRGKFATTIGYSDLPTAYDYVLHQEDKHEVNFLH